MDADDPIPLDELPDNWLSEDSAPEPEGVFEDTSDLDFYIYLT